jgi:hypothetical protein
VDVMIEILFILGLSIHNIEEALWLPEWSKYAKKFHREITGNEFRFAVIIITAIGYLVTFQYFIFSETSIVSKYLYFGFVSMMILNTIFPHLIATIALKKYAPGLITGILLNVPIGLYILINNIHSGNELLLLLISTISVTIIILSLIKLLFRIGKRLLD